MLPKVNGPTEFTAAIARSVALFEDTWLDRDEADNFAQRHEDELVKAVVRPDVEAEVRKHVDVMLLDQLANFKVQLESTSGKKGKKGKGKKKPKKAKKAKKAKGKKVKPLPGAKMCAGMDGDQMISLLVEHKIINNYRCARRRQQLWLRVLCVRVSVCVCLCVCVSVCLCLVARGCSRDRCLCRPAPNACRDRRVGDLVGEFNYLGSSYQSTNNPGQRIDGKWVPQDPSVPQVRQALTEYAILPLGSDAVRAQVWKHCADDGVKLPRSILLYGARGTGKSMLVEAVAQATGALLFNLSPRNLEGKFTEKGGATKLLHMVFTVAKDPAMGPAVIYIDEADKICANTGKKKTVSEGPARFKKDLVTYIQNLAAADAVVVIGCTSAPWDGDDASLRTTFERHLHVPYPRYGSLVMLWQEFLGSSLKAVDARLPDEFDVSSLAHVSVGCAHARAGAWPHVYPHLCAPTWPHVSPPPPPMRRPHRYSAGSILQAIKSTLTERRLERVGVWGGGGSAHGDSHSCTAGRCWRRSSSTHSAGAPVYIRRTSWNSGCVGWLDLI